MLFFVSSIEGQFLVRRRSGFVLNGESSRDTDVLEGGKTSLLIQIFKEEL